MARYTGPSWKISRRLKYSTLETGKELLKRPFAPGQHGQRRSKLSEYGIQLQEKQRVRFTYGLNERQFRKLFNLAGKMKGKHGDNFLILLESRLDNLVYRLGLATSRAQARQLVNHGHIVVDGKKVDIPSYLCKPGQKIGVKEQARKFVIIAEALGAMVARKEFVTFDEASMTGEYVRYPERNEILPDIKENLIVEFYNR
ncbi:MAG TPA: 30S ribosomal protein S4 [Bacilli bacterium]|nr:MAG: 30S ribosomal protein S4 [Tenericutes bacterium ADurb.BinA124]HNZ50173.1 30S ribosomal protein S4 [Bacilli bacterium]HOH18028.1 30S ribosomal protein S4 [Bacilli bacterium]HPN61361.1 30S ribosomal protein S4 [Bacilli bacterium]HPX84400.1 30S ribosomal protein S4 [Bacilli bacterium]